MSGINDTCDMIRIMTMMEDPSKRELIVKALDEMRKSGDHSQELIDMLTKMTDLWDELDELEETNEETDDDDN